MNIFRKRILAVFFLYVILFSVLGCSSPKSIHYYTLTPKSHGDEVWQSAVSQSVGIGPIRLPESHIGNGILSLDTPNEIHISAQHLWAGDLKLAVGRVISNRIASQFQKSDVLVYPWDARLKPSLQYFIDIDRVSGELDGEIVLSAVWTLYSQNEAKVLNRNKVIFSTPARSRDYAAYVEDINGLVEQLAMAIAEDMKTL